MFFVLQTANVAADAKNCVYPNRKEITSGDELKEAVRFDHVCGEFKKNYRNISNFLKSNVIVMDCDNDHSDDPAECRTLSVKIAEPTACSNSTEPTAPADGQAG